MKRVRGLALDLGGARLRLWTSADGPRVDMPSSRGRGRPLVSRGRMVDVGAVGELVGEVVDELGVRRDRLTVVATIPVLSEERHRDDVHAMLDGLGAATVVLIDSVKAAAFGAGVELTDPLLIVDVGAQLTEVALLAGGAVVAARRTPIGLDDAGPAAQIVEVARQSILELLQGEYGTQVVDALDRGILLTGGGALRPEITYQLGRRLGAVVCPAPAPHTVAVRGAAAALQAACRHPTSQ